MQHRGKLVFVRLFTGIAVPPEVTQKLSHVLELLRPTAQIRWTPIYNLHVTTKFIGEWPEARLQEVINALEPLSTRAQMTLEVSGIGWFPNPHSPRILFAAIKAPISLQELAADTEAVLEKLGIAPESKSFRPHLTLARIKEPGTPLGPLRHAIAELESNSFGSFPVSGFSLYLSKVGPAGSIYTRLADIRFTQ